jgi:hypothetical protein
MDFDGIDLEDLAGSESPIIGAKNVPTNEPKKDDTQDPAGKSDTDLILEEGLDLDFLAGIGDEDNTGNDDNVEGDKDTRVPADKTAATSSSQNTFTSLALLLKEAGTLGQLTDEDLASITDATSLQEAIDNQIKANEFAGLTEDQKAYLDAIATGVPHETYAQTKANADQYANITDEALESRPDLQAELIKRSFLVKGFDVEQATKYAVLALKGDDSLEDAKEARNALVAFENSRLQDDINARKQKQEKDLEDAQKELAQLKSKVIETSEVIPGIKVNSATREKIFQSMTTPIKVKDNNPLNEVMDLYSNNTEYKMKLHALHVITNGFKDFSKFTKTAKSAATLQLEKTMSTQGSVLAGNSMRSNVASASQIDIRNALKDLKL